MFKYLRNILFFSFLISSIVYPCVRGDNCFIPEANAGENQTYYKGSTVTLDGSGSFDPEGADLTYNWTVGQLPSCENYISGIQVSDATDITALIQECESTAQVSP